ncbi:lytic transglycosylase domain-containing protein [Bradyrhizobium sp.]|uniref:lytic transglycosylase domain-containing protein n=1 Tax=Bradyrhizobium sp. TaxID=376 RepID=UPI0025C331A6|nr:lytic transglycosylase domain-containing protein [Bradyrhizobium sp.]
MTEASDRFAIPEQWICAVISAESAGNARAISPRGALGLMQIMPASWVESSVRYDLGLDPFDPHDNIIAGSAYLRELLDRFGPEGFLAAYNAGARRYQQHLATGQPLPGETQIYLAMLAPLLGNAHRELTRLGIRPATAWQHGHLFVRRSVSASSDNWSALSAHQMESSIRPSAHDASAITPRATGLFVRRASQEVSR